MLEVYRRARSVRQQLAILKCLAVRWDLLADAALGPEVWSVIARQMGPQALRMNLNTLIRHGVFDAKSNWESQAMVEDVARRIADAQAIRRSRQFPYQYLAAYLNAAAGLPAKVRVALHEAAEVACGNIPRMPGPVLIGLDVSGSMQSSVTGFQQRSSMSKVRCVDVAALFAAAIVRRNPDSVIVPFDTIDYRATVDPSDSILSIAERLARFGGGATDCSVPLQVGLRQMRDRPFSGCVIVSDNQSWVGAGRYGASGVMTQWQEFRRNQIRLGEFDPKLVCIDIHPSATTQAQERSDILNVGGFSDAVFHVVASFFENDRSRFVAEVESIEL